MSKNLHALTAAAAVLITANAAVTIAGTTDSVVASHYRLPASTDDAEQFVQAERSPKPNVKGKVARERLRLTATTRTQKNRLDLNVPRRHERVDPASNNSRKPSREKRRTRYTPRNAIRINIGICGRLQPDGTMPGPNWCQPREPARRTPRGTPPIEVVEIRRPQPRDVTWDMVRTETKETLFAKLRVFVQPKGRTLVNLDTIVYTRAADVYVHQLTLLGFPVVVEAVPMEFTWAFGDGTERTTTSPGSPYPSKEITHKYMKRGSVGLSVTTHYAACYTVADLERQCVDDVPITGPATPLQVREAIPVLVEPER